MKNERGCLGELAKEMMRVIILFLICAIILLLMVNDIALLDIKDNLNAVQASDTYNVTNIITDNSDNRSLIDIVIGSGNGK